MVPLDRRDLRLRLFEIASGQAGHFTAAQAKSVGYSYQAQAHHVHAGNWQRVGRGLFRLREWIPGIHDDLARWVLWSKLRGVISHDSALAVHGIGEFESARVHLTVPVNFRMSASGVRLHRADLPDGDIANGPGFRLTTVARSLADVAGYTDTDQLAEAIREAVDSGRVSLRTLRARAEDVDVRGALQIERALSAGAAP